MSVRNILSIVSALVLLVVCCAGCGGGSSIGVPSVSNVEHSAPTDAGTQQLSQQWASRKMQTLSEVIAEINAYEVPLDVEPQIAQLLKDELIRVLSELSTDRWVSVIADGDNSRVSNLAYDDPTDTLTWSYYNLGDYNQDGVVSISDLTPVGQNWGDTAPGGIGTLFPPETLGSVIDSSGSGQIDINDITAIGQNWEQSVTGGYRIYTSSDAGDIPTKTAHGNGAGVVEATPTITADALGDNTTDRLHFSYTFPADPGETNIWLRPVDGAGDEGIPSNAVTTYSAGGYVYEEDGTTPLEGVLVSITGDDTTSDTTDSSGYWSVQLLNGNYTATPTKIGWTFDPENRPFTVSDSDVPGLNFTGTADPPPTFTADGYVYEEDGVTPIPDVTMSFTGGLEPPAYTDETGHWVKSGIPADTYTVTPTKANWSFDPTSRDFSGPPDVTVPDFTGTEDTFTAGGYVYEEDGTTPLEGVLVSITGDDTTSDTTDSSGYWSAQLLNGNYTATPTKIGWTFDPENRPFTVSGSDVPGLDFIGTPDPAWHLWSSLEGEWAKYISSAIVNGNPAVCWYDVDHSELQFIRASDPKGITWPVNPVTVDSSDDVGQYCSLAIVDGNPAIAYFLSGIDDELVYKRAVDQNGNSWGSTKTIDDDPLVNGLELNSLAVVSGNPAVAYCRGGTPRRLMYARATDSVGDTWGTPVDITTCAPQSQSHSSRALAVVNGNPAIAYKDTDFGGGDTSGDLAFVRATNSTGSSWGSPVGVDVDSANDGWYVSHAIVNGKPAISYYKSAPDYDLMYVIASNTNGSSWESPVTVDSSGNVGLYTSLAVVGGNPAISYYHKDNKDLKYCRATDLNGTIWGLPEVVDGDGTLAGQYTSLVEIGGYPAISYYDATNQHLDFAVYY